MMACKTKLFVRRIHVLALSAGCLLTWLVQTSDSLAAPQDAARQMADADDAARFLQHATWGPTAESIQQVQTLGIDRFLDDQFQAAASSYPDYPPVLNAAPEECDTTCRRDNYSLYPVQNRFFVNAMYGSDQLRQRVAFALHQIFVVAGSGIGNQPSRIGPYLQILDRNAFGNVRQLLYEITLNPAMGNYLDMAGNRKASGTNLPNENFAREILQLFSIGLLRLNPDGTPQKDAQGLTIPTYDQAAVNAFARVFTGWNYAAQQTQGITNYAVPMVATESNHDTAAKTLLRGVTLPAGQTAAKDLSDALDNIFQDPSFGPFFGKQMIQHLVTSNPSAAYVERVTSAFNNNGSGVRGDMRAVLRVILTDREARARGRNTSLAHLVHPALLVTNLLRAFNAKSADKTLPSDGYLNPQTAAMGMDIFNPPSVFSYFSPLGSLPGNSSLKAPEFGILNTSTSVRRANFVNQLVFASIAVSTNAPQGTSLDFASLQAQAADPAAMVATLNTLMLNGAMAPEMQTSIVQAVNAVAASNPLKRARTAVYLVATSAQFQVER